MQFSPYASVLLFTEQMSTFMGLGMNCGGGKHRLWIADTGKVRVFLGYLCEGGRMLAIKVPDCSLEALY